MSAAGGDPNRQSLLSRKIKELEGYFAFPLLDRRSTPHQLTEAGRQMVQHTAQFLTSLERSVEQHTNSIGVAWDAGRVKKHPAMGVVLGWLGCGVGF